MARTLVYIKNVRTGKAIHLNESEDREEVEKEGNSVFDELDAGTKNDAALFSLTKLKG